MSTKGALVTAAVAALIGGTFLAPAAYAAPANDAAATCKAIDDDGGLDQAGITRGECVNLIKGPASEQSNNFIAAVCGFEFVQDVTGTTNKGQCIKVLRSFSK